MTQLKIGDVVICKIKNNKIVSPYSSYDEKIELEIIALDKSGYFFYVPEYYNLHGTTLITISLLKNLNINKKFLDSYMVYTVDGNIANIHNVSNGVSCCACKEFFPYAEPNQKDGSFKCWSCRFYPTYL